MSSIDPFSLLTYIGMFLLVWIPYGVHRNRRSARNRALLAESQRTGMIEPPSLHPVIDPSECLGCGSCVPACPEGDVLGLIDDKAVLVRPSNCSCGQVVSMFSFRRSYNSGVIFGNASSACAPTDSNRRKPVSRASDARNILRGGIITNFFI